MYRVQIMLTWLTLMTFISNSFLCSSVFYTPSMHSFLPVRLSSVVVLSLSILVTHSYFNPFEWTWRETQIHLYVCIILLFSCEFYFRSPIELNRESVMILEAGFNQLSFEIFNEKFPTISNCFGLSIRVKLSMRTKFLSYFKFITHQAN